MKIQKTAIYAPSEDIVAREIDGELIIVPLAAGIGDMEGELYTVNQTARSIWDLLDGKRNLNEVITALTDIYDVSQEEMERDIMGILDEMLKRRILVEVKEI